LAEILAAAEVTKILKINRATLYHLIERGELRIYKFGRNIRFKESDIKAFIDAHERK